MDDQSEVFWAWFAGFVDGEGTITLNVSGSRWKSYVPMFVVANTRREILEDIAARLGVAHIGHVVNSGKMRDGYKLVLYSATAIEVVRRLRPYLRLKQAQADILLSFPIPPRGRPGSPVPPEVREVQARACAEIRKLNKRGRDA